MTESNIIPWKDAKVQAAVKERPAVNALHDKLADIRIQANGILAYYGIKDPFKGMNLLAQVGNVQDYLDTAARIQDYLDKVTAIARANQPAPTVSTETARQRLGNGGNRRMGNESKTKESDMAKEKAKPATEWTKVDQQEWEEFRNVLKRDYRLSDIELSGVIQTALKMTYEEWRYKEDKSLTMAKGLLRTAAHALEKARDAAKPKQAALDLDGQPAAQPAPVSSQAAPVVPQSVAPKVDAESTSPEDEPEDLAGYFDSLAKAGDKLAEKTAEPPAPIEPAKPEPTKPADDIIEGEIVKEAEISPVLEQAGSGQPTSQIDATSPGVSGGENGRSIVIENYEPSQSEIVEFGNEAEAMMATARPNLTSSQLWDQIKAAFPECQTRQDALRKYKGKAEALAVLHAYIVKELTADLPVTHGIDILDMPDFHPAVIEQPALAVTPVVQQQLSFRVPSQAEMVYVDNLARAVARSGFYGSVNTVEKAQVIMYKGLTLGIEPLSALDGIDAIETKRGIVLFFRAKLLKALVERTGQCVRFDVISTDKGCTVTIQRKGRPVNVYSFNEEDARAAGLLDSTPAWQKYKKRMYSYRAIGIGVDIEFPEVRFIMSNIVTTDVDDEVLE